MRRDNHRGEAVALHAKWAEAVRIGAVGNDHRGDDGVRIPLLDRSLECSCIKGESCVVTTGSSDSYCDLDLDRRIVEATRNSSSHSAFGVPGKTRQSRRLRPPMDHVAWGSPDSRSQARDRDRGVLDGVVELAGREGTDPEVSVVSTLNDDVGSGSARRWGERLDQSVVRILIVRLDP